MHIPVNQQVIVFCPALGRFGTMPRPKAAGRSKCPTVYNDDGSWVVYQHHDDLRQLECPRFVSYYRDAQKIVGASEWESLMAMLRTPLPTTVWINDTDAIASEVRAYYSSLGPDVAEEIGWYPIEGMAWRIAADKVSLRKEPRLASLRAALIAHTAMGVVSRQEEVSMIPPLLLDIKPHDAVLDMCASPGSKTAQALVALGRHKIRRGEGSDGGPSADYHSRGIVVANELDAKRANMLVHQVRRLRALFPFALFTNHDGRHYPRDVLFDKVICDVVCSGDGTIRKAPYIFRVWSPQMALDLHPTQCRLAIRGAQLLRVGGRMVYSTCSLNPIENEAVVAHLLHIADGAMVLVDVAAMLPRLRCAPGMTSWVVTDGQGSVCQRGDGYSSLHPPQPAREDLAKCARLLPQHCNGGCFFIAVLEKVKTMGGDDERKEDEPQIRRGRADDEGDAAVTSKRPQYLPASQAMHEAVKVFYEASGFPCRNLVIRAPTQGMKGSDDEGRACSFVSDGVLEVVQSARSLCIVSCGLRTLAPERMCNGWRICHEAAAIFVRHMSTSSRCCRCTIEEAMPLLISTSPLKDVALESLPEGATLAAAMANMSIGPFLLLLTGRQGEITATVGLRARSRVQLLVDAEDIVGLRLRLGIEVGKVTEVDDE